MTKKELAQVIKKFERKMSKVSKGTTVKNCTFTGIHYDEKAVDTISLIATGLIENSKALGSLAHVLKASNVEVECLIKVDNKE